MIASHRYTRTTTSRPGYVLIAVLVVVAVLSLAAYRFAEMMGSEHLVATRSTEVAQAKAFALSGVHYTAAALADPTTFTDTLGSYPFDNAGYFSNITVGNSQTRGGGRFAIVSLTDAGSSVNTGRYTPRYGVEDESAKININALILQDPSGNTLQQVLSQLPVLVDNPALVDAIIDWVDADDNPRANGAESSSYQTYLPRNGPLNSLDELLLVQGMTPDILYGSDRNRNGQQDPNEPTDTGFSRGLADYLTVYGRMLNVDSTGQPKISVNDSDLVTLNQNLASAVGQQMADYIVAYRMFSTPSTTGGSGSSGSASGSTATSAPAATGSSGSSQSSSAGRSGSGTGSGSGSGGTGNSSSGSSGGAMSSSAGGGGQSTPQTVTGSASDLRTAVQQALAASNPQSQQKISNSVLSLLNTQVTLPQAANAPQNAPTVVIPCPLNDPNTFKQLLPSLLDKTTAQSGFDLQPRLNVSTASPDVLTALLTGPGGLTQDDVNNVTAAQPNLTPGDPETVTGAWLVTQGGVSASAFQKLEPYVTGATQTYRVQSIGYFATGGPVARVEAVVDVNQGQPRIVYFRDLTDLGAGFTPPR